MDSQFKFNAKLLSMFGQNGSVFGAALDFYHDRYKIKVLTSDMAYGAGLSRFRQKFPDDFYDVGIAEQNLIGIAAGLVSEGFKCVATAQSCFLSMRGFEPIRQFMGYMQFPIILVGINSGFSLTFFGNSHYALEDISLMRTIPNMTVLSPADAGEAVKAFEAALKIDAPVYIRLSGTLGTPIVYSDDYDYDYRKVNVVFNQGTDVVFFATGSMVFNSMKAAERLSEMGIMAKVLDVHCIKPIDETTILSESEGAGLIVSVEEHFVVGGLGTVISEVLAKNQVTTKVLNIGVKDGFGEVGDYQFLLSNNGLSSEKIVEAVKTRLG